MGLDAPTVALRGQCEGRQIDLVTVMRYFCASNKPLHRVGFLDVAFSAVSHDCVFLMNERDTEEVSF